MSQPTSQAPPFNDLVCRPNSSIHRQPCTRQKSSLSRGTRPQRSQKLDKKLDERLSEHANVILEAVGELMEKKLDQKFDPVISKLDGIMKGVEALQQQNTVGAEQLRRHTDQLQKHEARISKLETAS